MSEIEAETPYEAARQLNSSYLRNKYQAVHEDLSKAYYAQVDITQRVYAFVLEHLDRFV